MKVKMVPQKENSCLEELDILYGRLEACPGAGKSFM
jgi:hypothetical protein